MIALCFVFTAPKLAARQLPPEVLLDQLLLRAQRLVDEDDLDAAVVAMDEALGLGAEHGLELPPDLRFEHARVSFAVGLLETAKASVTEYLTAAGREGEFYVAALALLEDVDQILDRRDAPECSPEPEGAACWMELTSHPGCYVWNPNPQATETATWTGECPTGFAQGPGTLIWTSRDGEQEVEGNRRYGRNHGDVVVRDSSGLVQEGTDRFGKRNGRWVLRSADGAVYEGPYVDGEPNGQWVVKNADGAVYEGPYVDGEPNGQWVVKNADGDIGEGPYVNGEQNGRWVWRDADGGTREGPYVDGEQHGRWVHNWSDGTTSEGEFLEGEWHGQWVVRHPDGRTAEGPYVDGERNGHWVLRYPDGAVREGPYVDGERHGRWRVRPPDGETYYVTYVRGVPQEP